MAVKQFTKYGAPLESFEYRQAMVGLLKPGRYNGFDTATNVSGLEYNISHTLGNIRKLEDDNVTNTFAFGAFMTNQGQIYHEDSQVNITLDPEISGIVRYDALVATVPYSTNSAGNNPTYEIVKGINTLNWERLRRVSGTSSIQVILGVFSLNPNTSNDSGVSYEPYYESQLNGGVETTKYYTDYLSLFVKETIENYHSGIVDINENTVTLTDEGSGTWSFNVLPEYRNKLLRVKDYSGPATKIRAKVPNNIYLRTGGFTIAEDGFKCQLMWDELPFEIIIIGIAAGTNIRRYESGKIPENRAQYTKMEIQALQNVAAGVTPFELLITGDLATS